MENLKHLLTVFSNLKATEGTRKTLPCHNCIYSRSVPSNAHIMCINPDDTITGDIHGIKNGWFMYPMLYDPIWATSQCHYFKNRSEEK